MEDFKDLVVWQKSHRVALDLYQRTRSFPREELFGVTGQMRRAATSIPANLAEGCGRRSDGELLRFVQIARGSASELEYHLILARDLGLLSAEEFHVFELRVLEVQRMLAALSQSVGENLRNQRRSKAAGAGS
jgi:four helix bundle protein